MATIELGGKPYVLGFTLGAMRRAKELGVLAVDVTDTIEFTTAIPSLVWACLDEQGRKEFTHEAVSELINPNNMQAIADALGKLFGASLPKREPEGNEEPAAATKPTAGEKKRSTLTNSGRSAVTTSG